MIISGAEILERNGSVFLSAKVAFEKTETRRPETAWFSFPQKYKPFIHAGMDAFAAGFLPIAMALGEDLRLEGPLSPHLLRGLMEYQAALTTWFPGLLRMVPVQAGKLETPSLQDAGNSCASLFSGGVDSSFTIFSHLPQGQTIPAFQIKYALFVHGLDLPLQDRGDFDVACQVFGQHLNPLGIEVIPCRTNIRYFSSGLVSWTIAHGSASIAAGVALAGLLRYLLVPSSYEVNELVPLGSSPITDHWLSSETFKVIHHGATFSRAEKMGAIANWEPAHHYLRVCVNEKGWDGVHNCSKCEKCIRTMVLLDICGALDSFETFQKPFDRRMIATWIPKYDTGVVWVMQYLKFARSKGRNEYVIPLYLVHIRGKLRQWLRMLIRWPTLQRLKRRFGIDRRDIFHPRHLENP